MIRDIMLAKSERTVADVCVTGSPLTQSLTCSSGSSQAGWLKPLSAPSPPLDHTAHAGPHQLLQSFTMATEVHPVPAESDEVM